MEIALKLFMVSNRPTEPGISGMVILKIITNITVGSAVYSYHHFFICVNLLNV